MNAKRTIKGKTHNIPEITVVAMAETVSEKELENAKNALSLMGHENPSDELVQKYAYEKKVCAKLSALTGAYFQGQLGKIDFSSTESAIDGVNSYLNRRNAGHRARWNAR